MKIADKVNAAARHFSTVSGTGKAWWFLGGLAILRNPDSAPRTPVLIEMRFPQGGASPLHAHAEIDDTFYILEGEIVVRCGDDMFVARAGDMVSLPHGKLFTLFVVSEGGARLLIIHDGDSFLSLIEEFGSPATEIRLPREGEFNADPETVMRLCEKYHTPVMGPPLSEKEARGFLARMAGE